MATGRGEYEPQQSELTQRARLAVLAVFFVHGAVFANWVPLIPSVQDYLLGGPRTAERSYP